MPKMLPALPQAFGDLKDVFLSAMLSTQGLANPLQLPKVKSSIVILVDGLGWFQLQKFSGHASFISKHLDKHSKGYSGFPSTTAASLVSLASGVTPSEHGFIGYKIFDRASSQSINLLSGIQANAVTKYLTAATLDSEPGSKTFVVTRPEYIGSGFSAATFPNSQTIGFAGMEERFEAAFGLLSKSERRVIYLYVPELDQTAHKFGVDSHRWLNQLELLDSLVRKLAMSLSTDFGVLLTADHGVIDVQPDSHIYLDDAPALSERLIDVGGDPRATFLYLRDGVDRKAIKVELEDWLVERANVFNLDELISHGLYSTEVLRHSAINPDLVVLAGKGLACYHREFAKTASLAMIGQHGGLSDEEIAVPRLRFGGYSSSLLVP